MKRWILAIGLLLCATSAVAWMSAGMGGGVMSGADTTPPAFSSATINADEAAITLTEDVVITNLDDGDFVMTGSTTGAQNLTSCSEEAGVISCTAASSFVNGETVTLAYSGGADEVEDAAGNDLDTFSGESVTNNTPAAGGTWYYPSGFSDSDFETNDDENQSYQVGSVIATHPAGNITEIGFKMHDVGSATECKITVYDDSATGSDTLDELASYTISSPTSSDTWNDISIDSIAVTLNMGFRVALICNNTYHPGIETSVSNFAYGGATYAAFPTDNFSWVAGSNAVLGVRAKIE